MNYTVSWEIDIEDTDSPYKAALKAKKIFQDAFTGGSNNIATILTVKDSLGAIIKQVDTIDDSIL